METVSLTKRFNHDQFRKPTTMTKLANRKNQKNILKLAKEPTSPDLAPSSSKPSQQQQHQTDPAKQELHPQKINLSLKDEHNALITRPLTSTIIYGGGETMSKTTNILQTILKKASHNINSSIAKPAHKRSLPLVNISNLIEQEPSVGSNQSETFGERLNEIKYRYSSNTEAVNPENKFTGAHIKLKQQIIDHYTSNNSNLNTNPNGTTTNRSNYTSVNNIHAAVQTPSVYTQQPKVVKLSNKPMLNLKILKNRLSNSNKTINVGESSSAEFDYVSRIRLSNTSNNSTKQTTKSLTPEHTLMPKAFKLIRKSANRSRSKYHGFEAAQSLEHEKPKSERSESPVLTNITKTKEFTLNSYFNNINNRNKLLTATDGQDEPAQNDETGSNFNGLYSRKSKLQNNSAGNNNNNIGFNFETLDRSNESLKSFSMNKIVPEDAVKKLPPTLNFINGNANVGEASKTHVSKKEVNADIKKKIENEQSKDTKYYDRPDASSRKIKEEKLNVDEIIYLAANKKKVNEWLDRHVLPFVNTNSVENDLEL